MGIDHQNLPADRSFTTARVDGPQLIRAVLLFTLLFASGTAQASLCDARWDGDKLMSAFSARPPASGITLWGNGHIEAEITVAQLRAFSEARDAVSKRTGRAPKLIVCSGSPNAFALGTPQGEVVLVTTGMMTLVNGDRDMAAMVIGHEYAHQALGHTARGKARRKLLDILGSAVGAARETKAQKSTHIQGLRLKTGQLGALLLSRKFDRDQERAADKAGFNYMVAAGFNPLGAIRLSQKMQQLGTGGAGLFFADHPGWPERSARFRAMIAATPAAQALVAQSSNSPVGTASRQALTHSPIQKQRVAQQVRECLDGNSPLAMQVTCMHSTYLSESSPGFLESADRQAQEILGDVRANKLSESDARQQLLCALDGPHASPPPASSESAVSIEHVAGATFGPHDLGLLVRSVAPNGLAARAGLQRGDIITKINGHYTASLYWEYAEALLTNDGDSVTLTVLGQQDRNVTLSK
jgi:Zn-dependent protease with chaperone function